MNPEYTNDLIHETSPYLLQHAHNPVNWVPWGEKAMKDALETNKLIIVSIGYSTCHWCHVMERESFEDEEVAGLMNAHFVNIKVDREERPDLDQIYMAAVQLMTGTGGWPLNCICLPDGRPIYGGTYFPKEQWMSILRNLTHLYRDEPEKVRDYADKLEQGIKDFELIEKQEGDILSKADLEEMVLRWSKNFDMREGGPNKTPKFPLPNNYEFLLRYAFQSEIPEIKNHVDLTLQKMALGGIYDQIGGGFSRYSVDVLWKVPHFEKMLYDNGQLIGLYAKAYQWTKNDLYKEVVYQTVDWLEREMRDSSGAFYSAIDADSEGVEGKFYVWNKAELKSILDSEMYNFALKYFSVDSRGLWDGNYILLRTERDDVFARKNNMTVTELKQKKSQLIQILFDAREYRLRPGLDDKSLTSWNAIAIKGLLTAYRVFGEKDFFTLAKSCLLWIEKSQWTEEKLWRTYKSAPHSEDKASVGGTKGKSGIEAFLDDYAFLIDTYIEFYTTTLDEAFLKKARQLTLMAVSKFWDNERAMFYYTPEGQKDLIARKMEVGDNVIPASNSVMAKNLYALSRYYGDPDFRDMAVQMLVNVSSFMSDYGSGYSNWAMLATDMLYPSYELVLTGKDQKKYLGAFNQSYYPHVLVAGGETEEVPILKNRLSDKTLFYLCVNGSCRLPEEKWEKILETIGSEKY